MMIMTMVSTEINIYKHHSCHRRSAPMRATVMNNIYWNNDRDNDIYQDKYSSDDEYILQ